MNDLLIEHRILTVIDGYMDEIFEALFEQICTEAPAKYFEKSTTTKTDSSDRAICSTNAVK